MGQQPPEEEPGEDEVVILELQALLQAMLPSSSKAYIQPPAGKLTNPAILIQRDYARTHFADNSPYRTLMRFQVTVIDRDPLSKIPSKVAALPMCTFNRFYPADGLNHNVYQIFYGRKHAT